MDESWLWSNWHFVYNIAKLEKIMWWLASNKTYLLSFVDLIVLLVDEDVNFIANDY